MKPHISSAETGGPRAIGLGLLLAVIACHDEFASEPVTIVPVDPAALEVSTMMVRDTDTIVVRLADRRASIAGIGIHWTSSNSSLLELRSIPPAGNSRSDSLEAQIRIQAIAHQHGRAVITATIDQLGITAIAIEDTVTVLERWAAVTAGGGYTCGLTIEQDAYCWGGVPIGLAPTSFGLGNGASNGSDRPMQVIGGYKFTILSAGDDQTCGATAPLGLLYCWGRNVWGELGNGSLDNSLIPTVVVGGRRFRQVITKTGLTCGVISDAFLTVEGHRRNTLCWGRSSLGEIGNENVTILTEEEAPVCGEGRYRFQCILKPFYTVTFPEEEDFVLGSVSVGGDFACGIAQSIGRLVEGSVWCWGLNDQSQLGQETAVGECRVWGDNDQFPPSPVPCNIDPVQVIGGLSFKALSSGGRHSCGVASTMSVYCWGSTYGPTPVAVAGVGQFDSISVGGSVNSELSHTCALTTQGQAYCWGDNTAGELGNGELPSQGTRANHPEMQRVLQDTLVFVAVSASKGSTLSVEDAAHTCGLTRDGAIYCWGDNSQGALGIPDLVRVAVPTRISEPAP